MQKMYSPARIAIIFIVFAFILTIYVSALYNMQVYQPRLYAEEDIHRRIITRKSTIAAARGNIYDRNGVLLASGRPSHIIRLDWAALRGLPETNDVVLELIHAATDAGISYSDTFPVTKGAPFEYMSGMTATQRNRLDEYLKFFNLNPEIEASDLLAWMGDHYRIDFAVSIQDARLIIGVRYELEVRAIIGTITPYIFASDVSTDFISYISERNLTGVYIETDYIREYHTLNAPHILGYIGLMDSTEYEYYKELGYPMTARVGKVGIEYAFEEYLHGSEGERNTILNEEGTVLRDEITKYPVPGQHIYLTIDLDLQIVAENALRSTIEAINAERRDTFVPDEENPEAELELIPGGAVVVLDVNTGEVLASVSYPGFNLRTLTQDWGALNTDPASPMLNRAMHGSYSPGSTFKMVTALAGLRDISFLSRYYPIEDLGIFTRYEDQGFTARCWIYRQTYGIETHNIVDMVKGIECSCNYYFMEVAYWLAGRNADNAAALLDEASMDFGLGLLTGVEISERAGMLANPDTKYRTNVGSERNWYAADVILAGFGQSVHRFTPLQLANYAAIIGNGGTRYSLSVLRRIVNSDFSEILLEKEPEILGQIEESEYIEILQDGMRAVVNGSSGTARATFRNYRIPVSAKTGTAQAEGATMNDAIFICYAPSDEPEIAIAVAVEKGGSGADMGIIARTIMDRYFITESSFQATPYGQLIP